MILDRVRITVLSAPLDEPVPMSFSHLASRDMVLVELEADGVVGLGESWVNYPAWAATERVATLASGVVPLLAGLDVSDPGHVQRHLSSELAGVARQWGAPGPVWQAISAIDIGLWDLRARREQVSIAALLTGGTSRSQVAAYASGIGPTDVEKYCVHARDAGYRTVKARVGFGRRRDEATLAEVRAVLGEEVELCVDANQAWSVDEAAEFCRWSAAYRIGWLEEPVTGNRLEDLEALAARTDVPLACGENLYGADAFARYARSGVIDLIQPDLAKCGGFTMVRSIAESAPAGRALAPHCYGGAIVTAASVQLAAAYASVPYLEIDARPNPLREGILTQPLTTAEGRITVPSGPGLGVELDRGALERYVIETRECDLRGVA